MSMQRKVTREVYEAREIVQPAPSRDETVNANKKIMGEFHSTLRPIKMGNPNRG